jgi:thymidine kinase
MIGAEQEYEARCPAHHNVPGKPERKLKEINNQKEE